MFRRFVIDRYTACNRYVYFFETDTYLFSNGYLAICRVLTAFLGARLIIAVYRCMGKFTLAAVDEEAKHQ